MKTRVSASAISLRISAQKAPSLTVNCANASPANRRFASHPRSGTPRPASASALGSALHTCGKILTLVIASADRSKSAMMTSGGTHRLAGASANTRRAALTPWNGTMTPADVNVYRLRNVQMTRNGIQRPANVSVSSQSRASALGTLTGILATVSVDSVRGAASGLGPSTKKNADASATANADGL